jgi:hypothetical protein
LIPTSATLKALLIGDDNIGNKLDSDPDAIEFALWSAAKHLRQATDEIEDVGEKNLSELLSRVDSDPLGDEETIG